MNDKTLYICENKTILADDEVEHLELEPFNEKGGIEILIDPIKDESVLTYTCHQCRKIGAIVFDNEDMVHRVWVAYPKDKRITIYNTYRCTCKHCNLRINLLVSGVTFHKEDVSKLSRMFSECERCIWEE